MLKVSFSETSDISETSIAEQQLEGSITYPNHADDKSATDPNDGDAEGDEEEDEEEEEEDEADDADGIPTDESGLRAIITRFKVSEPLSMICPFMTASTRTP